MLIYVDSVLSFSKYEHTFCQLSRVFPDLQNSNVKNETFSLEADFRNEVGRSEEVFLLVINICISFSYNREVFPSDFICIQFKKHIKFATIIINFSLICLQFQFEFYESKIYLNILLANQSILYQLQGFCNVRK